MNRKSTSAKTYEPAKASTPSAAIKTGVLASANSSYETLSRMQQTMGNQAVQSLFKAGKLQAALEIGPPDDVYEQAADRVAEQVMRMPELAAQKTWVPCTPDEMHNHKCSTGNEKPSIQKSSELASSASSVPDEFVTSLGTGRPLDKQTREYFGSRFGTDFSHVRIHAGRQAAESAGSINARAYTLGSNIVFGAGQYQPETSQGKRLIAHELAHTVQQGGCDVKRYVYLANTTISFPAAIYVGDTDRFFNAIAGNHANLEGLINGTGKVYGNIGSGKSTTPKAYRKKLVKDILEGLLNSNTIFSYANVHEVFDEVYKRAAASLYMRVSQGTASIKKVQYPGSVGPQTNKKASVYWTVMKTGTYKFELNATGLDNAYDAMRSILFEATSGTDTTRMHCDYVISAIHFMTMAEDMGIPTFNTAVKRGDIKVWLQAPRSFDPTIPESMATVGDYANTTRYNPGKKSLAEVKISGEREIIVGDHLMFFNHSAYNSMNKTQGESWRLENAFVTDRSAPGNDLRFQGHGYYSPKSKDDFVVAMRDKFNTLYNRAASLISSGKNAELHTTFPFIKLKTGVAPSNKTSDHEVVYHKRGDNDTGWSDWSNIPPPDRLAIPLKKLDSTDYPNPFAAWGETKESLSKGTAPIWVWRPVEGLKD